MSGQYIGIFQNNTIFNIAESAKNRDVSTPAIFYYLWKHFWRFLIHDNPKAPWCSGFNRTWSTFVKFCVF